MRRTRERDAFTAFVKNTYRVLVTRGLRGCYVYFMNAPSRDFILSRLERPRPQRAMAAEEGSGWLPQP